MERVINYVVAPKRSDVIDQGDGRYRLSTWHMDEREPISHLYKKDPVAAAKDVVADEQPDFFESELPKLGDN